MATSQNPDMPAQKSSNSAMNSFGSTPNSRAIGLVALAIMIGILLLVVVDSDNSYQNQESASQVAPTTTVATSNQGNQTNESSTTTTAQVSGTKKPAQVSVVALNGSSMSGVATSVSNAIGELGYKMLSPGNDSSTANGTVVYYKAGFEKDAKQLSTNVIPGILDDLEISQDVTTEQFPSSAPTDWDQDNLVGANIVVVVGNA